MFPQNALRRWLLLLGLSLTGVVPQNSARADEIRAAQDGSPAAKIVLIAGPITGHPKDTHEYEKSVILLKHLLDTSPNLKGIATEAHFRGWPADPTTLDGADTIVIISDGGDRNLAHHPLYVGERLKQLEKQMRRGCGLVQFHWTTFHPSREHERITEWVGGYFDYETGQTANRWFSAIQTWEGPVTLPSAGHPICRGVAPFRVREEFYYNIRFRDADPRVTPIVSTQPPGDAKAYPVGWAVERADGGRGFGFTGGHFYRNWWEPNFRRLMLNAIVWTARREVPAMGVQSQAMDPARALIVTGHNHPAHDWRKVTAALIPVLEQDPRLVVDVTENVEDLATAKIDDYDLLVMNYSSWDRQGLSRPAQQRFVEYLKRGGGLSVIHFANGSFTDTLPNKEADWPEYRTNIVRRIWVHGEGQSGHDALGQFRVEITETPHPITAGLPAFDTFDELYFRQMGELPIEPLAQAKSRVTGQDEPMAWAYPYGEGRIFQTVLGHADVSVRAAGALIRRGSVWAARLTPLSFDPPLELTENVLFRDGSPWTLERSLQAAGVSATAPPVPVRPASPVADEGRFGKALDARAGGVLVPSHADFRRPPLTVTAWVKLHSARNYNILVCNEPKSSGTHWEMFTVAGSGSYAVYMPGMKPDHVHSNIPLCDGQWHHVGLVLDSNRVRLFLDGRQVADQAITFSGRDTIESDLAIGRLSTGELGCDGLIDEVVLEARAMEQITMPQSEYQPHAQTIGYWSFNELLDGARFRDGSSRQSDAVLAEKKK